MTYFIHYLCFALIYFGILFPIRKEKTEQQLFFHSVFFIYLLIVLTITIIPIPVYISPRSIEIFKSVNLIPFRDLYYGYLFAKREIVLNIIMLIPFGFFIPLLTRYKVIGTVFITFLFSLTIESLQLISTIMDIHYNRVADITDLITNTLGGVIGYFIFYFFRRTFITRNLVE